MTRGGQRQNQSFQQKKNVIHCAHSSRHRLLSIQYDVQHFLKNIILLHWLPSKNNSNDSDDVGVKDDENEMLEYQRQENKQNHDDTSSWIVFSNERCGSVSDCYQCQLTLCCLKSIFFSNVIY